MVRWSASHSLGHQRICVAYVHDDLSRQKILDFFELIGLSHIVDALTWLLSFDLPNPALHGVAFYICGVKKCSLYSSNINQFLCDIMITKRWYLHDMHIESLIIGSGSWTFPDWKQNPITTP
jgi:hypothetical protein